MKPEYSFNKLDGFAVVILSWYMVSGTRLVGIWYSDRNF